MGENGHAWWKEEYDLCFTYTLATTEGIEGDDNRREKLGATPRSASYLALIQQPSRDIIATSPGIALIIHKTRRNLHSTISQDHACNRNWILIYTVRAFLLE